MLAIKKSREKAEQIVAKDLIILNEQILDSPSTHQDDLAVLPSFGTSHKMISRQVFSSLAGKHEKSRPIYLDTTLLHRISCRISPWFDGLIVDLGCGEGAMCRYLARRGCTGVRLVNVDISEKMLKSAKRRAEGHDMAQVVADAEHSPFALGAVSLFMMRFALHHMYDPLSLLKQLHQKLRPGGAVLICDGIMPESNDVSRFVNYVGRARDPSHVKYLKRTEIQYILKMAGYKNVFIEQNSFSEDISLVEWAGAADPLCYPRLRRLFLGADSRITKELNMEVLDDDITFRLGLGIIVAVKPEFKS